MKLTPVDHDPFADDGQGNAGPRLVPVDGDPFAPSFDASRFEMVKGAGDMGVSQSQSVGRGAVQGATVGAGDELAAVAAASPLPGQRPGGFNPVDVLAGLARMGVEGLTGGKIGAGGMAAANDRFAKETMLNDMASYQNPGSYIAGNVLGGMAVPVGAANTLKQGAAIGAGLGGAYGFNAAAPDSRLANGAQGAAVGGVLGGALGSIAGRFAPKPSGPAPSVPGVDAAQDLRIPLTAGQRLDDPALMAAENAMAGGARGDAAQRVAQQAIDAQRQAIDVAEAALQREMAGGGAVIRRPQDAGAYAGQAITSAGDSAAARLQSAQAQAAARAAALDEEAAKLAGRAVDVVGSRINGAGVRSEYDAANTIRDGIQQKAQTAKQGYQQAYRDAFARDGVVDPRFFTGMARAGGQELADPNSPLTKYAPALSGRIMERLRSRSDDSLVEIDEKLTPIAFDALRQLDKVSGLSFGKVSGAPSGDVSGVSMRGLEYARRKVLAGVNAVKNDPQRATDARALRAVAGALDDEIEGVMQSALFSGDRNALADLKQARQLFGQYSAKFKQNNSFDDAGRAIDAIIRGDRTTKEVADYMLGSASLGASGQSVRLFDRLTGIFGKGSPEIAEIKGAAWARLTGGFDANDQRSAARVAGDILQFTSGKGNELAKRLFDAREIQDMRNLAVGLQKFASRENAKIPKIEADEATKLLIDIASKRLTPEDTLNALLGATSKPTTANIRLIEASRPFIGAEGMSALKQAQLLRLVDVAEGRTPMGAQKISERIFEFTDGAGRSLAGKIYSPEEISRLRDYGKALKQTVPRAGTTNPSNSGNRAAGVMREAALNTVLAVFGFTGGGVAGAIGAVAARPAIRVARDNMAAAQARRLFNGEAPANIGGAIASRISSASGNAPRLTAPIIEALPSQVMQFPRLSGPKQSIAEPNQEEQN